MFLIWRNRMPKNRKEPRMVQRRLALIGLGRWGRQYLRAATRLGVPIVVCHTRHQGGDAKWLADNYPGVRHTTSLAEALDHRLDGVAIATPRQSHAALTLECLRRDLHVLVEKPAVTTLADIERTHGEARSRTLVLQTGYTHCFDESVRELADMARRAQAPHWQFTWRKPAPETGLTDLIWEYYPHVFSIAGLMGDVATDQMGSTHFRAAPGSSHGAVMEINLPMRKGTGHIEVSSNAAARHKAIRLNDGDKVIAEWSDRRLLDLRRNRLFEAPEEPLQRQIRSFLDAMAVPSAGSGSRHAADKAVTGMLLELSTKAQLAGLVWPTRNDRSDRNEVAT